MTHIPYTNKTVGFERLLPCNYIHLGIHGLITDFLSEVDLDGRGGEQTDQVNISTSCSACKNDHIALVMPVKSNLEVIIILYHLPHLWVWECSCVTIHSICSYISLDQMFQPL